MSDQRNGAQGWLSNNQVNIQLASPGGVVSGAALGEVRGGPEWGGPRFVTVPDQRASHWAGRPGLDQILPPHVTDGETEAGKPCACLPGEHTVIGSLGHIRPLRWLPCASLTPRCGSAPLWLARSWGATGLTAHLLDGRRSRQMVQELHVRDAIPTLNAAAWRLPGAGAGARHPGLPWKAPLTLQLTRVEGGCLR